MYPSGGMGAKNILDNGPSHHCFLNLGTYFTQALRMETYFVSAHGGAIEYQMGCWTQWGRRYASGRYLLNIKEKVFSRRYEDECVGNRLEEFVRDVGDGKGHCDWEHMD